MILRERFERGDATERERVAGFYLEHRASANNWDLVDASAPYLLAERARADAALLPGLAAADSLWDRRIAIVGTLGLIRRGELGPTFEISRLLLSDPEDLIHKATGWMLREAGKRDVGALREFLGESSPRMPRTALRYAIERLSPEERREWLSRPRASG